MRMKNSKIEQRTKKINDAYTKFVDANKTSSRQAINVGLELHRTQSAVKKIKMNWMEYVEKELPHIGYDTVRRFMYLAKNFKKNDNANLLLLNRTNLRKLYQSAKGQSIQVYLKKNQINFDFDLSPETIRNFQSQILNLLQNKKSQSKPNKPTPIKKKTNKLHSTKSTSTSSKSDLPPLAKARNNFSRELKKELGKSPGTYKKLGPKARNRYLVLSKSLREFIQTRSPNKSDK